MTFQRNAMRAAITLVMTLDTGVAAYAQNAAQAPGAKSKAGGDKVEEVLVTAQRRSERLQDVPMSVAALTADSLEKSGITNTSDLARAAPSVNMPFYGSFLQPSIRGVSSTGANLGDNSNVAMYLDGVYQPQQIATLLDFPDVQQIEILKGPQGALYGQNATGGAILVNTLAPSFNTEGKVSASYGDYNAQVLRGYVTGGLMDKIAASVAVGYQDRDGLRTHIITGEHDRGLDSKVARGKLLFEPSDSAKITMSVLYSERTDSAMYAGVALNGNSSAYPTGAFYGLNVPVVTDPKKFGADPASFTSIRSTGYSIKGEFNTGAGVLSTTTAYSTNNVSYFADIDYTALVLYELPSSLSAHYFEQDVNFASEKFGRVSFLVGGMYIDGGEQFDNDFLGVRDPTLPPAPKKPYVFTMRNYLRLDKQILAGYADVNFDVTDRLVLTAGGRMTRETQRGFNDLTNPGTVVERPGGDVSFAQFTPRMTARYALNDSSNVYASVGKGFKSGGINVADLNQKPVDPEKITAYEVGFKGRPLDTVTLNAAVFYYDYKDLQVSLYSPPTYIVENAAASKIKGLDLDASWAIIPDFTLSAGIALLDAKYQSYKHASVLVPTGFGGNNNDFADLSGKRMLRSPTFTGNISANYTLYSDIGTFGAFVSAYHNSGFGFEASNRVRQAAYTTVDGEFSMTPTAMQNLRLVLWGKNLTDEAYLASVLVSQVADGASYAEPRTFGVRAEYSF